MFVNIYKGYYIMCDCYHSERLIFRRIPETHKTDIIAIADTTEEAFKIIDEIEKYNMVVD